MDVASEHKIKEYLETGRLERIRRNHIAAFEAFRAAAEIEPENVLIKIEIAAELRALERLGEAEATLDSISDAGPLQARILTERGQLLHRRGDHEDAAAAFKSAAAIDSESQNIKLEMVPEGRDLQRLEEADAVLGKILDINPEQTGALIELGHLRRQQGNHAGAAIAFKAAAASAPTNLSIQVELARDLRALGRLDQANAVLDGVLNADPRHLRALIERGHLFVARGDISMALDTFSSCAAVDPDNTGVQMQIAQMLRALGRVEEAQVVLHKFATARPHDIPAIVGLAHFLMETNKLEEAETVLASALTKNANNVRILATRGHLARRRGNPAEAVRHLASAEKFDPSNLDLQLELAAALREQGDLDSALRRVRSVLNVANHWNGWMQLGYLHRARGNSVDAIEAFRAAVAKEPRRAHGLIELARETRAAGKPKLAAQLLERVLAEKPNHLGALLTLADWALESERPDEALKFAQQAIRFHPGRLAAYLLAARAAAHALEKNQALAVLERARSTLGPLPDLVATQIHIARHYRDFNVVRKLIAEAGVATTTNFACWLEGTSFAIAIGDFEKAEQALNMAPATSKRERARVPYLRAQIAESCRQYRQAVAHYRDALALDPHNSVWHSELARTYLFLTEIDNAAAHLRTACVHDSTRQGSTGQFVNVSQRHTGQLIDEFVLDQTVLASLKAIATLPDAQQIKPLKELVRDNPDHTAPALLLLLALRRTEALANGQHAVVAHGASKITRRIAQYWHSDLVPDDVDALVQSWRDANCNYTHILFDDASAEGFLRAHCPEEVVRAFRHAREPQKRVDIFRLAYLAKEGGYFVDADDRCLAPLDTVISPSANFVSYQERYGTVGVNFIGASPGHPVIRLALENAVQATNRGDQDLVWLSTGPGLLTRALAQFLSSRDIADYLSQVSLFELWEIQRVVGVFCPASYKQKNRYKDGYFSAI